jgi:hypothetical protein
MMAPMMGLFRKGKHTMMITPRVLILTAILSIAAASAAQAGGSANSGVNWHSGQSQGQKGTHTEGGNGGVNGGDVHTNGSSAGAGGDIFR